MSLTNSPPVPKIRAAVVRQDLQSGLHLIFQHKLLKTKQMALAITQAEFDWLVDTPGSRDGSVSPVSRFAARETVANGVRGGLGSLKKNFQPQMNADKA